MPPPGVILFDLDGTLADSAAAISAALNAVWRARGRAEVDVATVRSYVGGGPRDLIGKARAALDLPPNEAEIAADVAEMMAAYGDAGPGGVAYPGATAVLRRLAEAGCAMAVCTNKPQAAAERLVASLGFAPYLAGVVGGDAAPRQKPDRAHVDATLALLPGARAADAVLVGDGPHDIGAAEAAGVRAIVARYGYGGAAALRPDLPSIGDIRELPALLPQLSVSGAGEALQQDPV